MADSFRDAVVGLLAEHTNVSRSEISAKIEVPSDDLLGDYAFPCFFLAKELKKSPVAIATETASRVNDALASAKEGIIERAHAAGPYINFFVNKAGLAATVLAAVEKEKGGCGGSKKGKISLGFLTLSFREPHFQFTIF